MANNLTITGLLYLYNTPFNFNLFWQMLFRLSPTYYLLLTNMSYQNLIRKPCHHALELAPPLIYLCLLPAIGLSLTTNCPICVYHKSLRNCLFVWLGKGSQTQTNSDVFEVYYFYFINFSVFFFYCRKHVIFLFKDFMSTLDACVNIFS